MDQKDREKIERIISDRKEAHDFLSNKKSKVYQSFLELERNTFKDNNLSKMNKELIALGISVIIDCESCMQWHINEALNSGASEDQIMEALEVAIEMGGGPATVSSRFAIKVLDFYKK
ncbi:MAG: carboxymuconolactone decarboxylase family protein [Promethearchaeota archaeon]|jgi:AhpD family alkylhydroperoxidase